MEIVIELKHCLTLQIEHCAGCKFRRINCVNLGKQTKGLELEINNRTLQTQHINNNKHKKKQIDI